MLRAMNTKPFSPVLWLAASLVLLLAAGCASRASREDISSTLRQDPDLVLDVLRDHPEELERILTAMVAARQERLREARRQEELRQPLVPDLSGDRLALGPADAPVVMVSYSDFLCGYCARAAVTVHELLARHPGQLRFVAKHSPHSRFAAQLALTFEALGRQDPVLAWRFHDEVFRRQAELRDDEAALAGILDGLAPDRARLERDLEDPALRQRLADDSREADRFGFDGTPSFVMGGVSLVGNQSLARFEEELELALRRRAAAAGRD